MKINTSELTGAALDWAVAATLNQQLREDRVVKVCRHEATTHAWIERANGVGSAPYFHRFSPSTNWAQGDPIFEQEGIRIIRCKDLYFPDGNEKGQHWEPLYKAFNRVITQYGPTPLIAATRCYVASELGDEIDIPDELK